MKILNNLKGDIDGKVILDTTDLFCLTSALELLESEYPRQFEIWGGETLLAQLYAMTGPLQEEEIKAVLARDHKVND